VTTHFPTEKYAQKLLGENEIEAVLQRLDRLTLEESRATVAQTLDVVYGLVNNMAVVMEGALCLLLLLHVVINIFMLRWQGIDAGHTRGSR
jgi:hypothetical protein